MAMTIRINTGRGRMRTVTDPHLTLHQLFSPAFPVGAFAWSHGAETAISGDRLRDAASVEAWLRDVLAHGAGWSDAVLLVQAAQGADVAALAAALAPCAERRRETLEQGAAFAATVRQVWEIEAPDAPYPVAVGRAVAALGLPLEDAVRLYLQAFAANITSACVRLIPLGQTDGQRITAALSPLCADIAQKAMGADLDDLGGFTPMVDVMGQRHAGLYARVFRS